MRLSASRGTAAETDPFDSSPPASSSAPGSTRCCARSSARGYRLVGPTVRDGAIVYDELESTRRPAGRAGPTSRTAAPTGSRAATTRRCSATPSAPHSWKRFLFPPDAARSGRRKRDGDGALRRDRGAERAARATPSSACARATCTRSRIQDDASSRRSPRPTRLRGAPRATRSSSRSTAARPAAPASASRWTPARARRRLRPRADRGARGRRAPLPGRGRAASAAPRCSPSSRTAPAEAATRSRPPTRAIERAAARSGPRRSTPTGIKDLLYRNCEHPRWDEVADRCLTCGNCTMVCPTCFCTHRRGRRPTSPARRPSARAQWDSCFTLDSLLHPRRQRARVRASRATASG